MTQLRFTHCKQALRNSFAREERKGRMRHTAQLPRSLLTSAIIYKDYIEGPPQEG